MNSSSVTEPPRTDNNLVTDADQLAVLEAFERPLIRPGMPVDPATLTDANALRLALSEAFADADSYRAIAMAALAEVHRLTRVVCRQRKSLRAFVHPNIENEAEPDDEATV